MASGKNNRIRSGRPGKGRLPFALSQRLSFIEESLFWSGEAARFHLQDRFGISSQRAALDFAAYRKMHPRNLRYDSKAKRYIPTERFSPRYYKPAVDSAIRAWAPAVDVPIPQRLSDPYVLRVIVRALRLGRRCRIFYKSLHSESQGTRLVSPHTFVFDGQRWHVRAFDHGTDKWCDFVVGRVVSAEIDDTPGRTPSDDRDWSANVVLRISPNKKMSAQSRRALLDDYGASDEVVNISTRRALLYYLAAGLGLIEWDHHRWSVEPENLAEVTRLNDKTSREEAPL